MKNTRRRKETRQTQAGKQERKAQNFLKKEKKERKGSQLCSSRRGDFAAGLGAQPSSSTGSLKPVAAAAARAAVKTHRRVTYPPFRTLEEAYAVGLGHHAPTIKHGDRFPFGDRIVIKRGKRRRGHHSPFAPTTERHERLFFSLEKKKKRILPDLVRSASEAG